MALAQIWGIVMGLYIGLPPPLPPFRDDTEPTWGILACEETQILLCAVYFSALWGKCVNPLKTAFEILSINGTWQLWRGQLGVYYK